MSTTDMVIIRGNNGKGGIVGITRNRLALLRWTLTCHMTVIVMTTCTRSVQVDLHMYLHEEYHIAAMETDADRVQICVS